MTVHELIEFLKDCPQDVEVLVPDLGQGDYVGIAPEFNPAEGEYKALVIINPKDEREVQS